MKKIFFFLLFFSNVSEILSAESYRHLLELPPIFNDDVDLFSEGTILVSTQLKNIENCLFSDLPQPIRPPIEKDQPTKPLERSQIISYESKNGKIIELEVPLPPDREQSQILKRAINTLRANPPKNENHPEFPARCLEPHCKLEKSKHGSCNGEESLRAHMVSYAPAGKSKKYFHCSQCSTKKQRRFKHFSGLWAHYAINHLKNNTIAPQN